MSAARITTALAGAAARASVPVLGSSSAPSAAAAAAAAADSFVRVSCTMNNVHVTVSDLEGRVVGRASGGNSGVATYKHRQRAQPLVAKEVAESAVKKAVEGGHRVAHVEFKGPSRSRGMLLRGILSAGLKIADMRDTTPVPTNGCRPKKARRL
jgi:small subunit ribosomal protein S11